MIIENVEKAYEVVVVSVEDVKDSARGCCCAFLVIGARG
jgi:hypothetical protein